MLVPAGVHDLDAADAAFDEAAGHEAVVGVGPLFPDGRAVHVEDRLRFVRDVGEFGHARLHAEGHFVLGDAGGDFRVAVVAELGLVEGGEVVEHGAAGAAAEAGGVAEVKDRFAAAAELHALVARREEAGAPVEVVEDLAAGRALADRGHDDEGGQVFGVAAEAVGHPGAERRAAGDLRAAEHE